MMFDGGANERDFSRREVLQGVVGIGILGGVTGTATAAGPGEQIWQFETGDTVFSSPTVVDGTIYVGSVDTNLYAIDAGSGEQQWQFETEAPVDSLPAVVDGTVYVGSFDNSLYAVKAATGEQQWQFETDGDVFSSPTVVDGTVYVGSYDNSLYAVEAGAQTQDNGEYGFVTLLGGGIIGVSVLGALLYRRRDAEESPDQDQQVSGAKMLDRADNSYEKATQASENGNYQTALEQFSTAIDQYTTAERPRVGDSVSNSVNQRIARRLEIARTAVTEITERQEFRESLAESVESAESCLQTALTAQADGDIVGARTRYRQARAQYDQALSELDDGEIDPSEWGPAVVSRDTQIATPPSDPTAVAEVGDGKSLEELAIDSQEAFEQTDTTALAPVLEMVATAWWEDETETSIQSRETIEEWRDIAAEQEETLR